MYRAAVGDYTSTARRGLTEKGYIGQFNPNVQVGDILAVILGCATPFLLRGYEEDWDEKGSYRIIGACYVHGVMDGEAVDEKKVETVCIT
jgi:hypothetical protein